MGSLSSHLSILTPDNIRLLATGLLGTILLSLGSWLLAFLFGIALATIRMRKIRIVAFLVVCFIEYQRNVPPLVHIFLWYFGVSNVMPQSIQDWENANHSEYFFTAIAIGLYYSAYLAEDIRSGLRGVSLGQRQAAKALGLSYLGTMRYVILPQAMRKALPPLISGSVLLVKTSSLAMIVGAIELTYATKEIASNTFQTLDIYGVSTVLYVVLALTLMGVGAWLSRRFSIVSR